MPEPEPPVEEPSFNRLFHQIIRDDRLSFNQKWRGLVFEIFGREALFSKEDMANIEHCSIFDVDFYRLNIIRWDHIAKRKLVNPVKWAEFLITAPLELFSWFFQRSVFIIFFPILRALSSKNGKIAENGTIAVNIVLGIFRVFLLPIHLSIHITVGIVRRFLAPVRYLIRPAIETAKNYPEPFTLIVFMTFAAGISRTITIFYTPYSITLVDDLFIANTSPELSQLLNMNELVVKLATVVFMSIAIGALLTKGFNTVRELVTNLSTKKSSERTQMWGTDVRNQQTHYPINIIITDDTNYLNKEWLDANHRNAVPLLIWDSNNQLRIYGRDPKYGTRMKVLNLCNYRRTLFYGIEENRIVKKLPQEIYWEIYEDINDFFSGYIRGHIPKKVGLTDKLSEIFHGIDISRVEVTENPGLGETLAFFTGTESFFCRRKSVNPTNQHDPISADSKQTFGAGLD